MKVKITPFGEQGFIAVSGETEAAAQVMFGTLNQSDQDGVLYDLGEFAKHGKMFTVRFKSVNSLVSLMAIICRNAHARGFEVLV